jgi:hypothetical protein
LSHILCPLCGWNRALSSYDPTNYANDILIVSFKGLGRGKGFEVATEQSLFGENIDPVFYEMIRKRIAELHALFEDVEEEIEDQDQAEEETDEAEYRGTPHRNESELDREIRLAEEA